VADYWVWGARPSYAYPQKKKDVDEMQPCLCALGTGFIGSGGALEIR
jgi:hypothetical protein